MADPVPKVYLFFNSSIHGLLQCFSDEMALRPGVMYARLEA